MKRPRKKWHIGPRSLFGQITLTLVCFAAAFLAVIYVYFLYQNSRDLEEHLLDSGTTMLEQSTGTIGQVLDDLSLMLHSTLLGPDVIPLALSPDLRDFESMRTITDALTSAAGTSTLIDAVYLYSSREDLGLSSDYTLSNYQDYSYAAVLARFQTRKNKMRPYEAHGTATYFYTENSDIYLIQGFPNIKYETCSCYILFHLDSEQFYRTVSSSNEIPQLFFNSAGERMFVSEKEAWSEEIRQFIFQERPASGSLIYDWDTGESSHVICRTDALTGWTCAYVTRPISTFALRYLHSNVLLVLSVLFMGLLCAAAIFRSARWISRPISELVQKMQDLAEDPSALDTRNEWEYLEHTYSHLLSQKEELERYMPLAAESLHDQLFRAILRQEDLPGETIRQQLAMIHSAFTLETPCAVFLVAVRSSDEDTSDQLSQELTSLELRDSLSRYMSERGLPFHILGQSSPELCLICGFPSDPENSWEALKQGASLLDDGQGTLVWGMGGLTQDLTHLSESMSEARNDLEFNRYHTGSSAESSEDKRQQAVYIGKIRDLLTTVRREDADRLRRVLPELLQDIDENFDGKEARQLYQLLLDLLLEQAAALKIDRGDLDTALQPIPDSLLKQTTEKLCREIFRRFQGQFNSGQQLYIDRAKEYILSRCNDSNLSLESTAEYVGINPTYLSRLFKSIAQQNFSTYLNQCRVDNAKRLLKSSDTPVQEIGYLTGFCSVATFFRVFKKHTGMTPKQFRQGIQQEEVWS